MKRTILTIMVMALFSVTAMAQNETGDSTHVGRVLGDTPRQSRSTERNILGAPVYYDTLGNVLGSEHPASEHYVRPKHHYFNRLEDEFCSTFFEVSSLFSGNDMAIGANLAYVPLQWGIYGSAKMGVTHGYLTAGPVLRLSDCGDLLDWQLFGGLTFSRSIGYELGIRLASTGNEFCWQSVAMGIGHVNRHTYFTLGLSLALTPSLFFIFW